MKCSVVYHSKSGNTKAMAEIVADGMRQVEGAEVRVFSIDAVEADWLRESVCLVAGSPTYYASISGEMKLFLETLGGSQGKPVIHLGPQAVAGRLEETEETFRLYGQRMAAKAAELFG